MKWSKEIGAGEKRSAVNRDEVHWGEKNRVEERKWKAEIIRCLCTYVHGLEYK